MSHIYREKREIPIPENGHINKHDGRVFVFLPAAGNARMRDLKRMNIGRAATEKTMYPNENFRFYFPDLWEKYYGGTADPLKRVLRPGMYALILGISYENGLYERLLEVFGAAGANLLLDYAMDAVGDYSAESPESPDSRSSEVRFSETERGADEAEEAEAGNEELFGRGITAEQCSDFMSKWLHECLKRNVSQAWIAIDGSHNDGESQSFGANYLCAVSAENGLPIAFSAYQGISEDVGDLHRIIALLNVHGIIVKGIILDPGFATQEMLDHLRSLHLPFAMMLRPDSYGYAAMLEKHGREIRGRLDHLVNGEGIFGIAEKRRIFEKSSPDDFLHLFYDLTKGSAAAASLIRQAVKAKKDMDAAGARGEKPVPPEHLRKYFRITENPDGAFAADYDNDVLQKVIDRQGFTVIGTSEDFGPGETYRIYSLRGSPQSGGSPQHAVSSAGASSPDTAISRFLAYFVSGIIRNEIERRCHKLGLDMNAAMREIAGIEIMLQQNGNYLAIHNETARARLLLASFDILPEDFDVIAAEVTARFASAADSSEETNPVRKKPPRAFIKREPGRPKQESGSETANPGETDSGTPKQETRGRPKGSRNRKTLERERLLAEGKISLPEKRSPGRPKGSKNKPKTDEPKEKRGPGRPRGSKNKIHPWMQQNKNTPMLSE